MTGFRLALGGVQELLHQAPDLTVLGKIVGGGLPVGAYGGRKEIMSKVMPAGPVFQAGTLSGNPLAMAAGLATLSELKENPPYARLERLGAERVQQVQTWWVMRDPAGLLFCVLAMSPGSLNDENAQRWE